MLRCAGKARRIYAGSARGELANTQRAGRKLAPGARFGAGCRRRARNELPEIAAAEQGERDDDESTNGTDQHRLRSSA